MNETSYFTNLKNRTKDKLWKIIKENSNEEPEEIYSLLKQELGFNPNIMNFNYDTEQNENIYVLDLKTKWVQVPSEWVRWVFTWKGQKVDQYYSQLNGAMETSQLTDEEVDLWTDTTVNGNSLGSRVGGVPWALESETN